MTEGEPAAGATVLAGYRRLVRSRAITLVVLVVALVAAFVADLVVGPSDLSIGDAVRALLTPDRTAGPATVILWDVRLPYAVMAILVGGALSLAGAEMQTILNNPLASPFTLGMSSAAIFGAALAIVLDFGVLGVSPTWIVPVNAFVFALGSVLLLQAAVTGRRMATETVVLIGVALFFTFNSLVAIMQFIASEQALQQLVFWTMGSLTRSTWEKIRVLALMMAIVTPFSLAASWRLTSLRLGEERAHSFGVDIARLRLGSLVRISILTAAAVAFVGTIAFVGLVGPHIARLLVNEDHRFLLPASVLTGALVMAIASVVSKVVIPGALVPIGLVTALIGVPFFLALIFARRARA